MINYNSIKTKIIYMINKLINKEYEISSIYNYTFKKLRKTVIDDTNYRINAIGALKST